MQVLRPLETFEMGVVQGAIQQAVDLGAIDFCAGRFAVELFWC
ncbi:hypothetical protein AB9F26_05505 [Falsihalocynthiibacter sp. BN13B15]